MTTPTPHVAPNRKWTGVAAIPLVATVGSLVVFPWRTSSWQIPFEVLFAVVGLHQARKVFSRRGDAVPFQLRVGVSLEWLNGMLFPALMLVTFDGTFQLRYFNFVCVISLLIITFEVIPRRET